MTTKAKTHRDGTITRVIAETTRGKVRYRVVRVQPPHSRAFWIVQSKGPQFFVLTGNPAPSNKWLHRGAHRVRRAAFQQFDDLT